MIVDKTGRKIKLGQIIDMMCFGMFQGKIIAIKEQPIIISPQQQLPPHIGIAISMTSFIRPDGSVPDVYILQEPDPKDPFLLDNPKEGGRIHRVS